MTDSGPDASDELILDELLAEWFEKTIEGEVLNPAEHCREYPHLQSELVRLIERESALESTLQASRGSSGFGLRAADSEPAASVEEALGESDSLADFNIISTIGQGGVGTVFLARQQSLKRLVALKVVRMRAVGDKATRLRFQREAEITAALDHPNIVPIYAAGESRGFLYIAMKLLVGPSLDRIALPMGPTEVARIGESLAHALQATHDIGVVHRDVKPANVIIEDDRPYLLDFGFARTHDDATVTGEGTLPGTLPYMAPECFDNDRAFMDPRIDIYSLGVTLYEALSGGPPFAGETPQELIRDLLTKEPPPLRLPSESKPLEIIVHRALSKEAHRRFASAGEFADELRRFLDGQEITSKPPSMLYRLGRRIRSNKWAAAFVVLLLAATITAASLTVNAKLKQAGDIRLARDRIHSALNNGTTGNALIQFEPLVNQYPESEEVQQLQAEIEANVALEDVLDCLQSSVEWTPSSLLPETVSRLRRFEKFATRPDLHRLALAIAAFRQDKREEAQRLLLEVRQYPLTVAAYSALLKDELPSNAAKNFEQTVQQGSGREAADDLALAATALRVQGGQVSLREKLLLRALDLDFENYRTRRGLSVVRDYAGQSEAALWLLVSIAKDHANRPALLASLARLHSIRGQHERSRTYYGRALRSVDSKSSEFYFALQVLGMRLNIRERKADRVLRTANALLLKRPMHRQLLLLRAYAKSMLSDQVGAKLDFEQVRGGQEDRLARRAAVALLEIEVKVLVAEQLLDDPSGEPAPEGRRRFRALASKSLKLARECLAAKELDIASAADLAASSALKNCGLIAKAWEALLRSISNDRTNLKARLRFASEVTNRTPAFLRSEPDDPDAIEFCGRVSVLAPLAREHARHVTENRSLATVSLSLADYRSAWVCDAILSYTMKDMVGAKAAAQRALSIMDEESVQEDSLRAILDILAKS